MLLYSGFEVPRSLTDIQTRSSFPKHLVNSRDCAKKYDLSRFKIIYHCNNVFDLIKIEAISKYLEKPMLCKQKEFEYKVSLFN